MVGGYLKWFEATSNPLHIVHIGFWESTVCGKAIVFPWEGNDVCGASNCLSLGVLW